MKTRPSAISHQPFRIALDVSQMVYTGHGVGRYTEELARELLRVESDIRFTYYAGVLRQHGQFRLRRSKKPWSKATWRLAPIPPRLASWIFNYTSVSFETFVGKQDLVHTSDWTHPVTSCPSVTTVHDLAFYHFPETVHKRVLRTQRRRLDRAVKFGSHFIADSENTKSDLVKIYGLAPERIDVVYPGIGEEFEPQKKNKVEHVKTKYHLPDQYLLTLGTREPRKNLPRLIEAVQSLRDKDKSIPPLVIAGRYGWGKDSPASPGVTLTGYVEDGDLPALYSGASAFVYPSLYEGFGFPVLEAMACGTPVVTSNISSLPELVGNSAVLVDPFDVSSIAKGIAQALASSRSLTKKGPSQAAKFTWGHAARQTIAVYNQILTINH